MNNINEYFSSAWILLSDTTIFLSNNTKIFHQYESAIRELRHRLERNRNNPDVIREVRKDVAEIRKSLRLQGYNLKLGSLDLKLEGFRNDEAINSGFKRCVIFLMEDGDVAYITGTDNHIELFKSLEAQLATKKYTPIIGKHYLWFKWSNRVLKLSGSATETVEDFDELKKYSAIHKEKLVKKLRNIS